MQVYLYVRLAILPVSAAGLGRRCQSRAGAEAPLLATWATTSRSVAPSKGQAALP